MDNLEYGSRNQAKGTNMSTERFTVEGNLYLEKTKQLVCEGNIRRVRVIHEQRTILETPLTIGIPAVALVIQEQPQVEMVVITLEAVVEELILLLALVELEAVVMLLLKLVAMVETELSTQVAVEDLVNLLILVEQVEKVLSF